MVHRPSDSRLLLNLLSHEKDYSKQLRSLLNTSHASLASFSAFAAAAPQPTSRVILTIVDHLSGADDALVRYKDSVDAWREQLKSLKDMEDDIANIARDREILVSRLLKVTKNAKPPKDRDKTNTPRARRNSIFVQQQQQQQQLQQQRFTSTSSLSLPFNASTPNISYTNASFPSSSKLAAAQAELRACEVHLANKERELEIARVNSIRDGLRIRCDALVECGSVWNAMGKEALCALDNLQVDEGALPRPRLEQNLTPQSLHKPRLQHTRSETDSDMAHPLPSDDYSSISPSQSVSQEYSNVPRERDMNPVVSERPPGVPPPVPSKTSSPILGPTLGEGIATERQVPRPSRKPVPGAYPSTQEEREYSFDRIPIPPAHSVSDYTMPEVTDVPSPSRKPVQKADDGYLTPVSNEDVSKSQVESQASMDALARRAFVAEERITEEQEQGQPESTPAAPDAMTRTEVAAPSQREVPNVEGRDQEDLNPKQAQRPVQNGTYTVVENPRYQSASENVSHAPTSTTGVTPAAGGATIITVHEETPPPTTTRAADRPTARVVDDQITAIPGRRQQFEEERRAHTAASPITTPTPHPTPASTMTPKKKAGGGGILGGIRNLFGGHGKDKERQKSKAKEEKKVKKQEKARDKAREKQRKRAERQYEAVLPSESDEERPATATTEEEEDLERRPSGKGKLFGGGKKEGEWTTRTDKNVKALKKETEGEGVEAEYKGYFVQRNLDLEGNLGGGIMMRLYGVEPAPLPWEITEKRDKGVGKRPASLPPPVHRVTPGVFERTASEEIVGGAETTMPAATPRTRKLQKPQRQAIATGRRSSSLPPAESVASASGLKSEEKPLTPTSPTTFRVSAVPSTVTAVQIGGETRFVEDLDVNGSQNGSSTMISAVSPVSATFGQAEKAEAIARKRQSAMRHLEGEGIREDLGRSKSMSGGYGYPTAYMGPVSDTGTRAGALGHRKALSVDYGRASGPGLLPPRSGRTLKPEHGESTTGGYVRLSSQEKRYPQHESLMSIVDDVTRSNRQAWDLGLAGKTLDKERVTEEGEGVGRAESLNSGHSGAGPSHIERPKEAGVEPRFPERTQIWWGAQLGEVARAPLSITRDMLLAQLRAETQGRVGGSTAVGVPGLSPRGSREDYPQRRLSRVIETQPSWSSLPVEEQGMDRTDVSRSPRSQPARERGQAQLSGRRRNKRGDVLDDETSSVSSTEYETGRENLESEEDQARRRSSRSFPGGEPGEGGDESDYQRPEFSASPLATSTPVRRPRKPDSGITDTGEQQRKRKSVRVSLQPKISTTPPATEDGGDVERGVEKAKQSGEPDVARLPQRTPPAQASGEKQEADLSRKASEKDGDVGRENVHEDTDDEVDREYKRAKEDLVKSAKRDQEAI